MRTNEVEVEVIDEVNVSKAHQMPPSHRCLPPMTPPQCEDAGLIRSCPDDAQIKYRMQRLKEKLFEQVEAVLSETQSPNLKNGWRKLWAVVRELLPPHVDSCAQFRVVWHPYVTTATYGLRGPLLSCPRAFGCLWILPSNGVT